MSLINFIGVYNIIFWHKRFVFKLVVKYVFELIIVIFSFFNFVDGIN